MPVKGGVNMSRSKVLGETGAAEVDWDQYLKSYYDKPHSTRTWSGFEVKPIYTPHDAVGRDYDKDVGDAGKYPFIRGIHRDMFRGRYWTRREVVGIGSPADI